MTWREEAHAIIAAATRDLPTDLPLAERKRVVDAARPRSWECSSWPMKAWQRARREYLVRYGYRPRTKPREPESLPLFGDGQ